MALMDFGVDLDDLGRYAAPEGGFSAHKGYGSGGFLMKQGRVFGSIEDDVESLQMGSKMLKKDDILGPKPMVFQTKPNLLRFNSSLSDGQLGSSPLTKPGGLINTRDTFQGTALSPFQPSPYTKVSGTRGPFTPSQWLELEHQALIFKYITTGVPVPHNLLLPLRKALNPAVFAFPAGSFRTNPWWGSFHIGISGSLDPEPGRCRRTDGKKWRCARDVAPDQKYCERHLNRGRHRSRKPVEGQNGQGTTATGATSACKAVPAAAPLQAAPVCNSVPNSPSTAQHQIKTFQSSADSSSAANYRHGFCIHKSNLEGPTRNLQNGSLLSSINLKVGDSISAQKQQFPYHELARTGLDFVSSDSCPQRNSYLDSKNFGFSSDLATKEPQQPQSLHHLIDQWPKMDDIQPERTLLSISIPVSSAEFSASLAPLTHEKPTFSQLQLAPEIGSTTCTCLGMGALDGSDQISWKTSLGGPLAEMLNSTSNTSMTASSSEHPNSSSQPHDTSLGCEFPTQNLSDRQLVDNNIWINVQQQCRDLPESRNEQNQRKE